MAGVEAAESFRRSQLLRLRPNRGNAAKKKGHGRRSLPKDLRRERIENDVSEAEKVCPCCQTPRIKIGEETSEQLDYQPAKLFVR